MRNRHTDSVEGVRALLITRRDAIVAALQGLDAAFGTSEPDAPQPSRSPRKVTPAEAKPKSRPAKRRKTTENARSSDPLVAAREDAVIRALKYNDGVATGAMLRDAMPKEPSLSAEQRSDAYRNCLYRLKSKGVIGRTGDTWSLVDIGSAR